MTAELRAYILDRDRRCIAARINGQHQCRTAFGVPHAADDRRYLTLDHVHDRSMMGKRAKSDKYHLVAACGDANNNGFCSAHREDERAYLAMVEPR